MSVSSNPVVVKKLNSKDKAEALALKLLEVTTRYVDQRISSVNPRELIREAKTEAGI